MITLSWQVSNDCGCLASDALRGKNVRRASLVAQW